MRRALLFIFAFCLVPLAAPGADSLDDGRKALQSGDAAAAKAAFEKAVQDFPKDSDRRAEALYHLTALEPLSAQKKVLLEQFIKEYPGHARRNALAWDLYHIYLGEFAHAEALRTILPLKDRKDTREQALSALAALSVELGKAEESLSYLAVFVSEYAGSPLFPRALLCRAEAYLMTGDLARAKKDYEEILARYRQSAAAATAYFSLAEMAGNAGDHKSARAYLDALIGAFPHSFEASLARGRRIVLVTEEKPAREVRVWEVQLAAFFARAQAERFVTELSAKKYISFVEEETVNGRAQYSVRMGFFRTRGDAETVLKEMGQKGYQGFIRTRTVIVTEDELD